MTLNASTANGATLSQDDGEQSLGQVASGSSDTKAQGSLRRSFFSVRTWQNCMAEPNSGFVFLIRMR